MALLLKSDTKIVRSAVWALSLLRMTLPFAITEHCAPSNECFFFFIYFSFSFSRWTIFLVSILRALESIQSFFGTVTLHSGTINFVLISFLVQYDDDNSPFDVLVQESPFRSFFFLVFRDVNEEHSPDASKQFRKLLLDTGTVYRSKNQQYLW